MGATSQQIWRGTRSRRTRKHLRCIFRVIQVPSHAHASTVATFLGMVLLTSQMPRANCMSVPTNHFLVQDGYVTVSTQKLTSAPYNAYLLEQRLFSEETF